MVIPELLVTMGNISAMEGKLRQPHCPIHSSKAQSHFCIKTTIKQLQASSEHAPPPTTLQMSQLVVNIFVLISSLNN